MTDIDPKALALRVAEKLDVGVRFAERTELGTFNITCNIEEARALAAFLRDAVSPWRPLPPPNYMDIIVLYDDGLTEFIPADENDYRWKADYGPKIEGVTSPLLWMPLPTPPARIEDSEEPSHERR